MNRLLMSSAFAATCLCSSAFSVNPPATPARSHPTSTMSNRPTRSSRSGSSGIFRMTRCWRRCSARPSGISGTMAIRTAAWRERGAIRSGRISIWITSTKRTASLILQKGRSARRRARSGGTGFGIWRPSWRWSDDGSAVKRHSTDPIQIVDFPAKSQFLSRRLPDFMNGDTGKVIPFDRVDDGADIVETSYLMISPVGADLLSTRTTAKERYLARGSTTPGIRQLNWHVNADKRLMWHWSRETVRPGLSGQRLERSVRRLHRRGYFNWCPVHRVYRTLVRHPQLGNRKTYYGYALPLGN